MDFPPNQISEKHLGFFLGALRGIYWRITQGVVTPNWGVAPDAGRTHGTCQGCVWNPPWEAQGALAFAVENLTISITHSRLDTTPFSAAVVSFSRAVFGDAVGAAMSSN